MMARCASVMDDRAATIKQKSKQNFYAYEGIFPHLNAFVCSVLMYVWLWGTLSDQTSNFHIFISLYKTVDKWYGITHSSSYLCAEMISQFHC